MSLSVLHGTTRCVNICDPSIGALYPKTRALLESLPAALIWDGGPFYTSTLIEIGLARRAAAKATKPYTVDMYDHLPPFSTLHLAAVEKELSPLPPIRLVDNLRHATVGRLWGCIPKASQDVQMFGEEICLNADFVLALENTLVERTANICKVLITVTIAHELTHRVHHRFFPQQLYENTPPGVGDPVSGESGWSLERKVFGGVVGVNWLRHAIGNFEEVAYMTIRTDSGSALKEILDDSLGMFVMDLEGGRLLNFALQAELRDVQEPLPFPLVNARSPPPPRQPPTKAHVGLGLKLPLNEVLSFVGEDRRLFHEEQPRAVHIDAGHIGRQAVTSLLINAGYFVVFIDKCVINSIDGERTYGVHIPDTNATDGEKQDEEDVYVKGVLTSADDLIREIEHPMLKLITTAVGIPVLDKIAPTLAKGIKARHAAGAGTINIIACENAIGATAHLAEKVQAHLDGEDAAYAAQHVGFPNCFVDGIVLPFEHNVESTLDPRVEAFFEWVVDGSSLKGARADALDVPIEGMTLTDNFPAYNERKLFTLNAGHAITAYLGYLKGLKTIDKSIEDPEIVAVVRGALQGEAGAALCRKHKFDEKAHGEYIEKIIARFQHAAIKDDVVRVGRQPLRKLTREDCLIGPARICAEYEIPVPHLAKGIAAALLYDNEEDEQSVEMRKAINEKGIGKYVSELTGFEDGSKVHKQILQSYIELEGWKKT